MRLAPIARRQLLGFAVVGAALFYPGLAKRVAKNAGPTLTLGEQQRDALAALPVLRGAPLTVADLNGKPVVVTFFASWCPPCRAEFDQLNALAARHSGSEAAILGVNVFEARAGADAEARLAAFLDAKPPGFRILGNGDGVVPLFNNVAHIPTLYVFGRDGAPVFEFVPRTGQSLPSEQALDRALHAAL
ncbi:MAG: TlpA family protein disulfide reductase [Kiloniellales bacterium]